MPRPRAQPPPGGVSDLADLPVEALRRLWAEHAPGRAPPRLRRLLLRELAWLIQEPALGGMDAETSRLLRAAVRAASPSGSAPVRDEPDSSEAHPKRRAIPAAAELTPGATLVRSWRGRRHVVTVLDGGSFEYEGRTYVSLSAIAREITGAHWSGPRFFGLKRLQTMKQRGSRRPAGAAS